MVIFMIKKLYEEYMEAKKEKKSSYYKIGLISLILSLITIILSILLLTCSVPTVSATNTSEITDEVLYSLLLEYYDSNNNNVLELSETQEQIFISVSYSDVENLEGISYYFPNLEDIDISGTKLRNLIGLETLNLMNFYATFKNYSMCKLRFKPITKIKKLF